MHTAHRGKEVSNEQMKEDARLDLNKKKSFVKVMVKEFENKNNNC